MQIMILKTLILLTSLVGTLTVSTANIDHHPVPRDIFIPLPDEKITLHGMLYDQATAMSPAVILMHGWTFPGVVGASRVMPLARHLQRQGFVVLSLTMRGWPHTGGEDDCGLRQVDDVLAALSWLATRPEIDADRVLLAGFSQGGQVALRAAAAGATVNGVIAYAPVTDLAYWQQQTTIPGIRKYLAEECSSGPGFAQRSPLEHAGNIRVPVVLVHGSLDQRVTPEHSQRMRDALQESATPVSLFRVTGAGHDLQDLVTGVMSQSESYQSVLQQLLKPGSELN
jgi:dipeptidyl aminopeptidase/acylaminoacyl peptidase